MNRWTSQTSRSPHSQQVSQAYYSSKLACNQASSGWACLPGKFSRLHRDLSKCYVRLKWATLRASWFSYQGSALWKAVNVTLQPVRYCDRTRLYLCIKITYGNRIEAVRHIKRTPAVITGLESVHHLHSLSPNCLPALDLGPDNGSLKCWLDSAQVIIYRATSFCQHVAAGWLPADSGSISFRQMRQKIEVKMICAIRTYRCVLRQDHSHCLWKASLFVLLH